MTGLPDPIARRDLLHDPKRSEGEKIAIGNAFFESGRFSEAMDFYSFLRNAEGAQRIRKLAIDQGDAFLLGRSAEVLGEAVAADDWRRCGEKALAQGKFRFAATAFGEAGDDERKERAEAQLEAAMTEAAGREERAEEERRASRGAP